LCAAAHKTSSRTPLSECPINTIEPVAGDLILRKIKTS
jgi:hypothetical protein